MKTSEQKKILIVEDDEILLEALKEKFEAAGFAVYLARDGESIVPLVSELQPNIVLLDLLLPKRNGFLALGELKSHADTARIPVVVLSNLGQEDEVRAALNLGAAEYLIKTHYTLDEVLAKVLAHLGK